MLEHDDTFFNFVDNNFTFSEMLFSFKTNIINNTFLKSYFSKKGYIGNIEDNLYKMSFFEQENEDIIFKRTLYLYLKYLYKAYGNREDLKYKVDYICEFFQYPDEVKHLIYYMPKNNDDKNWILKNELFKYLENNKILLKLPDYDLLDNIEELSNDNFTLISSGKYKNFLTTCKKEVNDKIVINIWSSCIIQNKSSYEFKLDSSDNFEINNIRTYKFINNDFFTDENKCILDFKTAFNKIKPHE